MATVSQERRNGKRTRKPRYRGRLLLESPGYPLETEAWSWYAGSRPGSTGGIDPARPALLSGPDWLSIQASYHRSLDAGSTHGERFDSLAAGDIEAIREVWLDCEAVTPGDLTRTVHSPYHGLDLDAVAIPDAYADHPVAGQLYDLAAYYLDLDSDIGRLVAAVLVRRGLAIGASGAESLADYLDTDAALAAACDEVFGGDYARIPGEALIDFDGMSPLYY